MGSRRRRRRVAVQLAKLAGSSELFTALGGDGVGRRAREELSASGVHVHGEERPDPTRQALCLVDGDGERTITTLGPRLEARGSDGLAWDHLDDAGAVYVTAGDEDALRRARVAKVMVVSTRIWPSSPGRACEPTQWSGAPWTSTSATIRGPGRRPARPRRARRRERKVIVAALDGERRRSNQPRSSARSSTRTEPAIHPRRTHVRFGNWTRGDRGAAAGRPVRRRRPRRSRPDGRPAHVGRPVGGALIYRRTKRTSRRSRSASSRRTRTRAPSSYTSSHGPITAGSAQGDLAAGVLPKVDDDRVRLAATSGASTAASTASTIVPLETAGLLPAERHLDRQCRERPARPRRHVAPGDESEANLVHVTVRPGAAAGAVQWA